jgi:hypothetical protein
VKLRRSGLPANFEAVHGKHSEPAPGKLPVGIDGRRERMIEEQGSLSPASAGRGLEETHLDGMVRFRQARA